MYKVTYEFIKSFPQGGSPKLTQEIKLYDCDNANELQNKIDKYLSNNHCSYHKNIKVLNIEKL